MSRIGSSGPRKKPPAHRDGGKLHRAFSILICDPCGRTLLQLLFAARSTISEGSGATPAAATRRRGEPLDQAAHRRLREELGFDTPLREIFSFIYRVADPRSGLTEHEYDHVYLGIFEGTPPTRPRGGGRLQVGRAG